jgi:hypothetical protein
MTAAMEFLNYSLCIDKFRFKGQIRILNAQPHFICVITIFSVYSVQRWAVMDKVMNLHVPYENEDILTK